MKRHGWLICAALFVVACGGADRATRKSMLEWAEVLQVEIATSLYNTFPDRLGDIDPQMRTLLTRTDAWGTNLLYRRVRDDQYHLISAGPDAEFGNEDDIVCVTGHFRDTMTVYDQHPLEKSEIP
jgi:hypothetical protein